MSDVLRQSTSRIEHLLEQARLLLQTGHPEAAYQRVLSALRLVGNDELAKSTVQRACSAFLKRMNTEASPDRNIDHLANLFQGLGLETLHVTSQSHAELIRTPPNIADCILAESGREQLNRYALEDGSCFHCVRCGAIVMASRREAHEQYWCP